MKILKTNCNFDREPLKAPFGFKGGYLSELWQTSAQMTAASGAEAKGLGTQSTLWSDAKIFTSNSEAAGNAMMFLITSYALKLAEQIDWQSPIDLIETILPEVYKYAKKVTDNDSLRLTFALNALVAVDNAAWILYCKENGITNFDDMIPVEIKPALSYRNEKLACVPLMSYGVDAQGVKDEIDAGYFFLKIKIGSDPEKDGNLDKMLEWDKNRLTEIHNIAKDIECAYTDNARLPYYLDANGRYDSKDRLKQLLDYADKIGALERIILLEEPFPEDYKEDVSDLPVRIAADESAHCDKDALERIQLGYKAIALKPIAKTMSMTLKIAKIAYDNNIPCFCADLTVNPILVDWNKNVAARLAPLPGMKIGVLESNGHQNYKNWQQMKQNLPMPVASWVEAENGIFTLDETFYKNSGAIL